MQIIKQTKSAFELHSLPPLSLYIHIPWCVKKCPYCDFNSHNLKGELPEDLYVDALIRDLELSLPLFWGRSIQTIFIGGGTPSLFSAKAIDRLLTNVRNLTNLSPMAEITMEINPGTVEIEHIYGYKEAGVNRVSFGIQSFNDIHLTSLGRIHNAQEALHAVELAKKIYSNINLDIIYGLPNQTLEQLTHDINQALAFDTEHLSFYNLTIEPNTEFAKNTPRNLPDNDLCYTMQDLIIDTLAKNQIERYEISAYAKQNRQCQHNLNYWKFGDYLGIGAGAHSKLSFHDKIIRRVCQKHPKNYMQGVINNQHLIEDRVVAFDELPFEFMLNALRLKNGFHSSLFIERTGLNLSVILSKIDMAVQKGLLEFNNGIVKPTVRGFDYQNDLLMLFI